MEISDNQLFCILDHTFWEFKRNEITVVDLGSNDGRFYALFKEYFGSEAIEKYVGVEPNVNLFESFLISKSSEDRINFLNKAIYSKSGMQADFVDVENQEAGNIFSSVSEKFKWGEQSPKTYKVTTISIDDLMNQNGIDSIDYLKVDIEGSEFHFIDSLCKDLCKNIKQISIEFHDFLDPDLKKKTKEYVGHLVNLGYTLVYSKAWDGRFGTDFMDTLFVHNDIISS